jgi:iron complex transport system permease protein
MAPVVLSLVALVVVLVAAASVGSVAIRPFALVAAVVDGVQGHAHGPAETIVWQLRLPRVLLAALVGSALALAGATFQGVFRNPLADPYLLGAASGAGFGASAVLVLAGSVPWLTRLGVPGAAFACALATVVLVMVLARRDGGLPAVSLILAGVVLGSILSAGTSFLMLAARDRAAGILSWLLGSFAFASWDRVLSVLPLLVVATVPLLLAGRALDVMQLGEESAAQLGVPVERVRLALLAAATLATAAAVAVAGVIGFVGLVVPHAVRLAFGARHMRLLPLSALWGAVFLVLADLFARTVLAPAELPVGIVTALVGGPFFLLLLRRQRSR